MKTYEKIGNDTRLVNDDNLKYIQFECFDNQHFYRNLGQGKWKVDLQGIIEYTLAKCGVLPGNITQSSICTVCRRDLFFTHRGDGGKTGSLASFMQLK